MVPVASIRYLLGALVSLGVAFGFVCLPLGSPWAFGFPRDFPWLRSAPFGRPLGRRAAWRSIVAPYTNWTSLSAPMGPSFAAPAQTGAGRNSPGQPGNPPDPVKVAYGPRLSILFLCAGDQDDGR